MNKTHLDPATTITAAYHNHLSQGWTANFLQKVILTVMRPGEHGNGHALQSLKYHDI